MAKNSGEIRCSFCNKTQDQVKKLIAGPAGVYICDECVFQTKIKTSNKV